MESFTKKIIFQSLIYTVLPKISFVVSIFSLPWISPFLTLRDYGIFGVILSYIIIFQTIISLGQNIVIQNAFFTHKKNYPIVWGRCFGIMIVVSAISSIIFYFVCHFILKNLLGDYSFSVFIFSTIFFLFTPFEVIIQNFYVLNQRPFPYSIGLSISGIVASTISIFLIRYYGFGYLGWVISLSLISLFNFFIFFYNIIYKEKIIPIFYFKKRFFFSAIKTGISLFPHQISLYVLNASDRLLLNYFKIPITNIGFYSQGYSLGSQGNLLVNGVFQSFSRNLQDNFRGDDKKNVVFIRRYLVIIPLVISMILFFISLWLKQAFFILFKNPDLNKSYPIAIIILCSTMYLSVYSFFAYPLSIKNKAFSISKISLLAALINVVGNYIFIPKYGINASLFFTYLSYLILGFAGILSSENRQFLNQYINIYKLCISIFLLNIFLLFISYSIMEYSFIFKFVATIFFAIGTYVFFRIFNKITQ